MEVSFKGAHFSQEIILMGVRWKEGDEGLHALTAHTLLTYSARMMMPPCNAQVDLPPGVHQATLVEVAERFGEGAPERLRVTERLQHVIALAQGIGKLERLFLWGSYVTDKLDPQDIDLFLIMSPDFESNDCTGAMHLMFDSEAAERELGTTVLAFQDALLALRRNQSPSQYAPIAKNFLYEIKKMEEEGHEYLQRLPDPEHITVA